MDYDITGEIGPLYPRANENPQWPMYSFDSPSYILWNSIAAALDKKGWNEEHIKKWLQSKSSRYALDGTLGEALEKLGTDYAATIDD